MRRTTSVLLLMGSLALCLHRPALGQTNPPPADTVSAAEDLGWVAAPWGQPPMFHDISGDRTRPGPVRYYVRALPSTSIGAHRHSADMRITVLSGRQFILMGDLETARVQHFDAGSTFVIPANAWHVEWFESDTLTEIEIVAPWTTERASPETPRLP